MPTAAAKHPEAQRDTPTKSWCHKTSMSSHISRVCSTPNSDRNDTSTVFHQAVRYQNTCYRGQLTEKTRGPLVPEITHPEDGHLRCHNHVEKPKGRQMCPGSSRSRDSTYRMYTRRNLICVYVHRSDTKLLRVLGNVACRL